MSAPTVLYAFHSSGCAVCEAEMPKVRQWAFARIANFAFVEVNVAFNPWRPQGANKVKATPTFIMMQGGAQLGFHEGAFAEESNFEAFLSKMSEEAA